MAGAAGVHPPNDAGACASRCAQTLARGIAVLGVCVSVLGCVSRSGSSQEEDADPDPQAVRDAHGVVPVDLPRGETEAFSPWPGTTTITVTLAYDDCLRQFYVDHPEYAQDGEFGDVIFGGMGDAWFDECELDLPRECRVVDIQQDLASPVATLAVRYEVVEPVYTPHLGFGPIPASLVEGCFLPSMKIARLDQIYALDASGTRIVEATEARVPAVSLDFPYRPLTVGMHRIAE
jgi:hypothetical protein